MKFSIRIQAPSPFQSLLPGAQKPFIHLLSSPTRTFAGRGTRNLKEKINLCDLEIMLIFFGFGSTFPLCHNWRSGIAGSPKSRTETEFFPWRWWPGDSSFRQLTPPFVTHSVISVLGRGAVFFPPFVMLWWRQDEWMQVESGTLEHKWGWQLALFFVRSSWTHFCATLNISGFEYVVRLASRALCQILFIT